MTPRELSYQVLQATHTCFGLFPPTPRLLPFHVLCRVQPMLRLPSGSSARRGVTDTSMTKLIPPIIYSHDTDEEFKSHPSVLTQGREEVALAALLKGRARPHLLSRAIIASRPSALLLKCDFREEPSLPPSLVHSRPAEVGQEPADWITAFIS